MGLAETKNALDKIAERIPEIAAKINLAKQYVNDAIGELSNMPLEYASIITEINEAFAANSTDLAWGVAKSEKDKLVAEFQALKTHVQSLKDAIDTA